MRAPLDITRLGEAIKPIRNVYELDVEGLASRRRVLLLDIQAEVGSEVQQELAAILESAGVSAIMLQSGLLSGIRVLSRPEIQQVKAVCEQMLNETQPEELTPDEAKDHARRVIEALQMRPELYEELLLHFEQEIKGRQW